MKENAHAHTHTLKIPTTKKKKKLAPAHNNTHIHTQSAVVLRQPSHHTLKKKTQTNQNHRIFIGVDSREREECPENWWQAKKKKRLGRILNCLLSKCAFVCFFFLVRIFSFFFFFFFKKPDPGPCVLYTPKATCPGTVPSTYLLFYFCLFVCLLFHVDKTCEHFIKNGYQALT